MFIARLRSWFSAASRREAQELYIALVAQSRKPFFYTDCAVPDSLDGRFDVILLHVFLMLRLLKAQGTQENLSRLLQECLFDDMDRSLREMGVGDMGVARRIKTMSKAVFARLEIYTQVFNDDAAFKDALVRNVYRGNAPAAPAMDALVGYVRKYPVQDITENEN